MVDPLLDVELLAKMGTSGIRLSNSALTGLARSLSAVSHRSCTAQVIGNEHVAMSCRLKADMYSSSL